MLEIINDKVITSIHQNYFCLHIKQENIHCPMLPPADGIPNYKAPEFRLIMDSKVNCVF